MQNYSVTVVIPFFNGNKYINETLDSIFKNQYIQKVIICVDKDSDRPKLNLANEKITILQNDTVSRGPGIVRALGFNAADTKYVAFIDSDDLWGEGKIKKHVDFMLSKNLGFSFHNYWNIKNGKKTKEIKQKGPYTLDGFLKKKFTIGCLTVMIDKEMIRKIPGNSLTKRNDYFMWFELINFMDKNRILWGGFDMNEAFHRLHKDSLTHSRIDSAIHYYKFLKHCQLSITKRIKYFFFYALNSFRNRQ